jgi:ElaA protein
MVRIGRICTRRDARGSGLAATLLDTVLERHAGCSMVLEAQAYLTGWYHRFGFEVAGEPYVEDGIAHVTMRRSAESAAAVRPAAVRPAAVRPAAVRPAAVRPA